MVICFCWTFFKDKSMDVWVCCIVVEGNTFKAKEILKKYHFGFSNGKWRKKIKANRYLYEKEIISAVLPKGLGIKIGIEYE